MRAGTGTWATVVSVPTAAESRRDGDGQAAFAATLVDEWVRCGVAHAVVCPGSRSTPLVVALAAQGRLAVHVRLDERSAGFTALGIGRSSGRPALVVTTSGTAAAELHAAVVEADLSGVPLIACTADRPPELRGVGAPQTIDQDHLFGPAPRWYFDPGVPDVATRSVWRSLAARSVAEATTGPRGPGPVHLNLPFREPLLGDQEAVGGVAPGRPGREPWHTRPTPDLHLGAGPLAALVDGVLDPANRGVITAGAGCGEPEAVLALAAALGWPVLAEPRSGLRIPAGGVIATADALLRSEGFSAGHRPDVVLRLGERWVSSVVGRFLAAAAGDGAPSIVVGAGAGWDDPEREATAVVRCDPTLFCREAVRYLGEASDRGPDAGEAGSWLASWSAAEEGARRVITTALGGEGPLSEPSLAHRLFARVPGGATVVVSSSMPVRDLEAFGLPRSDPPRVVANRGANGIDGVVSTAWGVALASGGPTVALVGDLAFLHDVSALVRTGDPDVPLTVVVADNGGGGIFSFLPPAAALDPPLFERLFATPPSCDVAAVAAGFGWTVHDLGDDGTDRLEDVLDRCTAGGSPAVVRVRLPDRGENVAVHDRIHAAVLASMGEGVAAGQQGRGS
jgi:2-succinyl-5-enolpyruvyl-6-hydroxy-3-cyclohexene-1-carboxylate synthase